MKLQVSRPSSGWENPCIAQDCNLFLNGVRTKTRGKLKFTILKENQFEYNNGFGLHVINNVFSNPSIVVSICCITRAVIIKDHNNWQS